MTLLRQLATKIEFGDHDECWPWTGATAKGYGVVRVGGRRGRLVPAHRLMYVICVDDTLPDELEVDHTCHNTDVACAGGVACRHRLCMNPRHLEAVTHRENVLRGGRSVAARNAVKTHCPVGHEYTPENTYLHRRSDRGPGRDCRTCHLERDRTRRSSS